MRKRVTLSGSWLGGSSQRGYWRARGRVAFGAVLGITAGLALLEAPPVKAAAPTCQEPPMASKVLQEQFKDVAPGVPYQAGVPPVTDKNMPKGDAAILRMVEDQMGFIRGAGPAETLHAINRLSYSGCGEIVEGGHTYEVTQYTYGIGLHQHAAREDIQAEGKVHLIRVVRDNEAWDESSPGVGTHSADKQARQRQLQLGRTPFGILNTIVNIKPSEIKIHDTGHGAVTLRLPVDGVSTTVVLDRNYRPMTVTQRVDRHRIVDQFTDYHDLNQYGLMIPRHIVETIDGHPHLTLHIIKSGLADYEVFPAPSFEKPFPPPAKADNFEYIGGGFGVPPVFPAKGSTPMLADGHPDLSGFWGAPPAPGQGGGGAPGTPGQQLFPARHGIFSNFEDDYFITGEQGSNIPLYKPQYWSMINSNQANGANLDPYLHCLPITPPRLLPPVRIVRVSNDKQGEFLFFRAAFGTPNTFQDIPVGPMFYKPDPDGTWQGDPAAHWDGDTLVVDTVGYNGQTWLGRAGYMASYDLKTTERLHRDGNRMTYDVTVEDPDYLQRPWVLPTEYIYSRPKGYSTIGTPCMWQDYPKSIGGTLG
ncbi:MAG: hypothetical protein ACREU2_09335 [Steroidobacteraceae bacterium]